MGIWTAHGGEEALEKIREIDPDIVLCDLGLPGEFDGLDVARKLREIYDSKLRLIALTGYGTLADKERSQEAGFDAHLTKPVTLKDIQRALR